MPLPWTLERKARAGLVCMGLAWACLSCSEPRDDALATPRESPEQGRSSSLTVRYWVAGCSVSEDLWRYRRESTTVTCDERGHYLEGERGTLVWPDYVATSEIDTLVVEGEGLDDLRFELWWSEDDSFGPRRSVAAAPGEASSREVRFDLAAAPEWQGRVRRFRLTWSTTPGTAGPTTSTAGGPEVRRVLAARATKRAPSS